jgi:16S rRNA (cytosine1402-N4)-methyltransferase
LPLTLFWYYNIKKEYMLEKDNKSPHIPVLLNEVLASFKDAKSGIYVDCTLGYGGHAYEILKQNSNLSLIGIDRDLEALNFSKERLKEFKDRVEFKRGSFSQQIKEIDFSNVSIVLADFGVSSLQLDKLDRGFSFDSDTLDMRMDQSSTFSAYELVNSYSKEMLEKIFKEFGEIKEASKLASAIVNYRESKEITSSKELADIIAKNIYKKGKIHPATLAFQAIRIEVNKELEEIVSLLDTLENIKPKGAIIGLITFHSLEDRLVKQRFRAWEKKCICPPGIMKCQCGGDNHLGQAKPRKAISAAASEIKQNPRSRSAKLRVFKFKD